MLGHGSIVGLGKVLGLAHLAVLPLGKPKLHVATALGSNSLLLVEAAADGTGGNGQVAVVGQTSGFPRSSHIGGVSCEEN